MMIWALASSSLAWLVTVCMIFWLTRLQSRELRMMNAEHADRVARLAHDALVVYQAKNAPEAADVMRYLREPEPEPDRELEKQMTEQAAESTADVVGFALEGGAEIDFMTAPTEDIIKGADESRLLRRQ